MGEVGMGQALLLEGLAHTNLSPVQTEYIDTTPDSFIPRHFDTD